jgi:uroporphyrinogen-III synthase
MSFIGKRVLALESRRANETAELIRRNGGEPFVAPSMRERPIEENQSAFDFAERLFRAEFDMVIFLTGVGTRYLTRAVATRYPVEDFTNALRTVTIVARGPKPLAALRELNVPVTVAVPEPNTWRELLDATSGRPERSIAVQEYGRPAVELEEALRARGAAVMPVRVYEWDLPEDRRPLEEAAHRLAAGDFHTALFTTSFQLVHLMRVAKELGIERGVHSGLAAARIASIGPTTSEMLREYGLEPTLEASHPKLGILVKEAADATETS